MSDETSWAPPDMSRPAPRANAPNCVCWRCKAAGPCTEFTVVDGRNVHRQGFCQHNPLDNRVKGRKE